MGKIQDEIDAFRQIQGSLERDHMGQWVLVYGGRVIDFYQSFHAAADDAVKKFGSGPFLIRQIGAQPLTLPASVMYRPHAR